MRLSSQAAQILEELRGRGEATVEALEKEGYDQSMVHRAALELQEKGLVEYEEEEEIVHQVTDKGREVIENGSPEHRLVQRLEDSGKQMSELQDLDLDVALGKAREKGWVEIENGEVELTGDGEANLDTDPAQRRLESREFDEDLRERGLVEAVNRTERVVRLTQEGRSLAESEIEEEFNLEARVKTPRTGKKHFYKQIIDYARRKWVEMGFEEMSGDFVVPSFLNFDALYTPQDHPAREMQDTFFMETPAVSDITGYDVKVENVKNTHENGWTTGSDGWGYEWSREEAERNVLRTHTTAVSIRRIHEIEVNEEELPRKFFTVSRNFRNETVDRFHLAEFYQTDGIVVGEDLSFRDLKGYISEFFEKMGYDDFRLVPSYFPYTEMSVEVHVWDEKDGEWVALGGAGMFRPEVVKPMLGFEATVLAWGLGIPRIAMGAAELEDIRELYRNDIEILENTPAWRPQNMEGEG
ncbi:MAG: phenylalanine--tRNA ligase subunit alpha [Candidatus Nanohaloarchaea archaeon]